MLTSDDTHTLDAASDLIWHRHFPTKVIILALRLLRNKFSTKDNLVAHGILTHDMHQCVNGCGEVETTQHLFLSCTIFRDLWHLVRGRIGVSTIDPYSIFDHFVQFTHSTCGSVARLSFMQLIWILCIWVL